MTNLEALSSAITGSTRLVCFETPTNPLLKVVDIEAVMARTVKARKADVLIAVDRCTFLSPRTCSGRCRWAPTLARELREQVPQRPL